MKTFQVVLTLTAASLGIAVAGPQSHAKAKPVFTSAYTSIAKDCTSGPEDDNGTDPLITCRPVGGYQASMYSSAFVELLTVQSVSSSGEPNGFSWKESSQIFYNDTSKIEWRLANGKPFAVIFPDTKRNDDGLPASGRLLTIRGLKGYETLNKTIPVKAGSSKTARSTADNWYLKH